MGMSIVVGWVDPAAFPPACVDLTGEEAVDAKVEVPVAAADAAAEAAWTAE